MAAMMMGRRLLQVYAHAQPQIAFPILPSASLARKDFRAASSCAEDCILRARVQTCSRRALRLRAASALASHPSRDPPPSLLSFISHILMILLSSFLFLYPIEVGHSCHV